jgi:Flp pilus assembly pilin Flp
MSKNKYLKAMSMIEYSMLVAIIVAALIGMQVYLKRAVSARWRQAADIFGYGRIYAP